MHVEVGDWPIERYTTTFGAKDWNTLLGIIREDKLDADGLDLILNRFLGASLGGENNRKNFVHGIKSEAIQIITPPY